RYIDLGASITYRSDQGEYQTLNFLSVDSSYEFYKVYQKTIKEPSPNPCTSAYKYYSFGIGNQVKNMNFKGSNRKMYLNARILARATDFNVSGDSINIVSQEENVVFTFNSDGYLTTFTLPFINKVTWPYQYYDTIILNNETFN
ncbi:hypothetical protein, partial [Umezakia ovalisporum]|uniref:hypothetical protein n=1 Tax=Umezakia ovalisporum TaxID=75695 RepID=UPI0039C73185